MKWRDIPGSVRFARKEGTVVVVPWGPQQGVYIRVGVGKTTYPLSDYPWSLQRVRATGPARFARSTLETRILEVSKRPPMAVYAALHKCLVDNTPKWALKAARRFPDSKWRVVALEFLNYAGRNAIRLLHDSPIFCYALLKLAQATRKRDRLRDAGTRQRKDLVRAVCPKSWTAENVNLFLRATAMQEQPLTFRKILLPQPPDSPDTNSYDVEQAAAGDIGDIKCPPKPGFLEAIVAASKRGIAHEIEYANGIGAPPKCAVCGQESNDLWGQPCPRLIAKTPNRYRWEVTPATLPLTRFAVIAAHWPKMKLNKPYAPTSYSTLTSVIDTVVEAQPGRPPQPGNARPAVRQRRAHRVFNATIPAWIYKALRQREGNSHYLADCVRMYYNMPAAEQETWRRRILAYDGADREDARLHTDMIRRQREIELHVPEVADAEATYTCADDTGTLTVHPLATYEAVRWEGRRMHHCIGNFAASIRAGNRFAFHLVFRHKGTAWPGHEEHATIMFATGTRRAEQFYGYDDVTVSWAMLKAAEKWCAASHFTLGAGTAGWYETDMHIVPAVVKAEQSPAGWQGLVAAPVAVGQPGVIPGLVPYAPGPQVGANQLPISLPNTAPTDPLLHQLE